MFNENYMWTVDLPASIGDSTVYLTLSFCPDLTDELPLSIESAEMNL